MTIKRKINDKDYIRRLLNLKTKEQLKQICRDYKIKGFSKYRVAELVDFVHNSLTEEQLENIFEIPENLIYSDDFNSVSDRELEKIGEIIKNVYPEYNVVNIERKDFNHIYIKENKQEMHLDFTVSFGVKMMKSNTISFKDGVIKPGYTFMLRKLDLISILKINQEGNLIHQIYHIDFGDFPDWSKLPSLNDWLIMANLNYKDGNYDEAINLYSMVLSEFELLDDVLVDILVNLGLSYACMEKYNKAIDSYMEAKDIDPNSSIIWINLGIAYKGKGDKKKAKKAFKKAYEINPEKKDIKENYIDYYN